MLQVITQVFQKPCQDDVRMIELHIWLKYYSVKQI
jgi:hypothetical protein